MAKSLRWSSIIYLKGQELQTLKDKHLQNMILTIFSVFIFLIIQDI